MAAANTPSGSQVGPPNNNSIASVKQPEVTVLRHEQKPLMSSFFRRTGLFMEKIDIVPSEKTTEIEAQQTLRVSHGRETKELESSDERYERLRRKGLLIETTEASDVPGGSRNAHLSSGSSRKHLQTRGQRTKQLVDGKIKLEDEDIMNNLGEVGKRTMREEGGKGCVLVNPTKNGAEHGKFEKTGGSQRLFESSRKRLKTRGQRQQEVIDQSLKIDVSLQLNRAHDLEETLYEDYIELIFDDDPYDASFVDDDEISEGSEDQEDDVEGIENELNALLEDQASRAPRRAVLCDSEESADESPGAQCREDEAVNNVAMYPFVLDSDDDLFTDEVKRRRIVSSDIEDNDALGESSPSCVIVSSETENGVNGSLVEMPPPCFIVSSDTDAVPSSLSDSDFGRRV